MMADSRPGAPRWVKVGGALLVTTAVLAATLALLGEGHGPERHMGVDPARTETRNP